MNGLHKAIKHFGTQAEFARVIGRGLTQGHVAMWIIRGRVPAEHCPTIERLTGVRCEQIRPDVEWAVIAKRQKNVGAKRQKRK